jgi:hypothetical protein
LGHVILNYRQESWEGRLARCEQDYWETNPAVHRRRFKITSSPRPSPPLFVEERGKVIALGSFCIHLPPDNAKRVARMAGFVLFKPARFGRQSTLH